MSESELDDLMGEETVTTLTSSSSRLSLPTTRTARLTSRCSSTPSALGGRRRRRLWRRPLRRKVMPRRRRRRRRRPLSKTSDLDSSKSHDIYDHHRIMLLIFINIPQTLYNFKVRQFYC